MANTISADFIRAIPKTDLHVHLDGSLRLETLIELAKAGNIELPSYDAQGLTETVFKETYKDLPDYLAGFAYTCAVLQNPENIERVAYELAQDNLAEGVRYVEVRFGPQLHIRDDFPIREVVGAVVKGMDRAKKEHNNSASVKDGTDIPFEYGIIVCALRFFMKQMSPYYAADVLIHQDGLPVVGFDLAGAEAGFPAGDHKQAFEFAHSHFIKKTVHAGEAYGPESIFQALTDCHANRIGHGTWLFAVDRVTDPKIEDPEAYVHNLAQYIADQRIHIEVNLTSNLQTLPSLKRVADHPLRLMLERHLSASICTDNRLVSNTTVSKEIQLAVDQLDLTPRQLRNLVVAGFKGSFFPGTYRDKRAYVRKVIDRYEALETQHLG
jgi:adenosine deaminase